MPECDSIKILLQGKKNDIVNWKCLLWTIKTLLYFTFETRFHVCNYIQRPKYSSTQHSLHIQQVYYVKSFIKVISCKLFGICTKTYSPQNVIGFISIHKIWPNEFLSINVFCYDIGQCLRSEPYNWNNFVPQIQTIVIFELSDSKLNWLVQLYTFIINLKIEF